RGPGAVDQQHGGRAGSAVLHDVDDTIVKPHEPVVCVWGAGHVLCHCAVSCHPVRSLTTVLLVIRMNCPPPVRGWSRTVVRLPRADFVLGRGAGASATAVLAG